MTLLQGRPAPHGWRPALPRAVASLHVASVVALLSIACAGAGLAAGEAPTHTAAPPLGGIVASSDRTAADEAEFPPRVVDERPSPTSRGGLRSQAQAPASPSAPTSPQLAFIQLAGPAAQASQASTGVPASVTIAQAILESDWGRATIDGANNYFGIKATNGPGPAGVVWAQTREFVGGVWTTVLAPFRAYNSMAESFVDHGRFLADNKRYAPAFEHKDDPREFARAIQQAGYATAPNYAQQLIALMDQYNLYRFDLPAEPEDRTTGSATS